MVGMLIKIGENKLSYKDVKKVLNKKDRKKASICAPANGLTLEKVKY